VPGEEIPVIDNPFGVIIDGKGLIREGFSARAAAIPRHEAEGLGVVKTEMDVPVRLDRLQVILAARIRAKGDIHSDSFRSLRDPKRSTLLIALLDSNCDNFRDTIEA
jgi:hypothetical protein